jgi:hypothetical protein
MSFLLQRADIFTLEHLMIHALREDFSEKRDLTCCCRFQSEMYRNHSGRKRNLSNRCIFHGPAYLSPRGRRINLVGQILQKSFPGLFRQVLLQRNEYVLFGTQERHINLNTHDIGPLNSMLKGVLKLALSSGAKKLVFGDEYCTGGYFEINSMRDWPFHLPDDVYSSLVGSLVRFMNSLRTKEFELTVDGEDKRYRCLIESTGRAWGDYLLIKIEQEFT